MRPLPRFALATVVLTAVGCPDDPSATGGDAASPDTAVATVTDPLSMPEAPTLSPDDAARVAECAVCHAGHVAEWRDSHHAYAMIDPVFRALVAARQAEHGGTSDRFCLQCHSAVATRGGEITPGFRFDALSPVALEGVNCVACHAVTSIERLHNAGHTLDLGGPLGGPHADPIATTAHTTRQDPLFESAEFCAGCHDLVEVSGLPLERPYDEWLESPAGKAGRTCQSCHMPSRAGRITADGPDRTLHDHRFVGVDVPATAPAADADALDAAVQTLLEGAATLELQAGDARPGNRLDLFVTLTSHVEGHALPTGSTFLRELWVHATVTDAEGRVLYATGDLDDNGDLRGPFSALDPYGDPGLIQLGARLLDLDGNPTIFPWHAVESTSTALPAGHTRTHTLYVPLPSDVAGPLTVEARLRFRSTPPHVLRALGLTASPSEARVRDLTRAALTVPLTP